MKQKLFPNQNAHKIAKSNAYKYTRGDGIYTMIKDAADRLQFNLNSSERACS